jgi:hypothetical protein
MVAQLIAHTCNPSYSGDREQEDCGSKPANWGKTVCEPLSWKKNSQKRAGGIAQGAGPEFKKKKENTQMIGMNIKHFLDPCYSPFH